jgi:hypothetical protein
MGSRLALVGLLASACGARLGAIQQQQDPSDAPQTGVDGTAPVGDASGLGAWGAPAQVTGAADPTVNQDDVTLNSTLTELYFKKRGASNTNDLFWMTRNSPADAWGPPTELTQLNTTLQEESPRISTDDLTLYFGRSGDIFKSTRTTTASPWGAPTAVTEVNTTAYEKWLAVCGDNYFLLSRAVARAAGATDQDLFVGRLDGTDPGTLSAELSTAGSNENSSFLSTDCKTAIYTSNRGGQPQIYMATRPDAGSPFGTSSLYEQFGTSTDDEDAWMSVDQRTFFFASIRNGSQNKAIYTSTR